MNSEPTPATALPRLGDSAPPRILPRAMLPPPAPPTERPPGALASLVYGLLSVLCCGMPVAGLILGIAAIVCAGRARAAVLAAPHRYRPSGAATGGLVTGIIGTVLNTLVVLFWATLVLLLVAIAGAIGSALGGHHAGATALPGPML